MRFYTALILLVCFACKDHKKSKSDSSVNNKELSTLTTVERGAEIYKKACAQCHMPHGNGIPKIYPPLNKSNWLTEKRTESIHAVKYGLQGPIKVNGKPYENIMTPPNLTDQEVADVLNYVLNAWENTQEKEFTAEEVAEIKK